MLGYLAMLQEALGKKQFRKYKRTVKKTIKQDAPEILASYAYELAIALGIDHQVMVNGTLELIELLQK